MAVRAERGPAALSPLRTVALAIGFVCALAASVTIFVTEDAKYLRIGILVALWGFVFAALAAGRRQTEQALAASTEVELRKSYELELEREVAARREYELRLEAQLRREVQEDFSSQVGVLHEEMVRLRRELSEHWDSELRVERMVMRTQSVRMGGDRREALEHAPPSRASIDASPLPWEPPPHFEDPPADELRDQSPPQDASGTMEFPIVRTMSPPMPTAPVQPVRWPGSATPAPPSAAPYLPPTAGPYVPPAPTYDPPTPPAYPPPSPISDGSPSAADPDDVLARVLAESGASAGGRRRKHRYADED